MRTKKPFRLPETGPAVWRVHLDGNEAEVEAILAKHRSYIAHLVEGQRESRNPNLAPMWRKSWDTPDFRMTYTNRAGQEQIDIIPKPVVTKTETKEFKTPYEFVMAPQYLIVTLDPVAVFKKEDVVVMICSERDSTPLAYGRELEEACCNVDNPGGNTNKYVKKVRTGWMTGTLDPFDFTSEQFAAFEQSFRQEYHLNGTDAINTGGIGYTDEGVLSLSIGGRAKVTGVPNGQDTTLEPYKYGKRSIVNDEATNWETIPAHRLLTPWYRTWESATGGHPVETMISAYYDQVDAARAQQGQPPETRPTKRYNSGTSVNMLTTWDRLTGNYCNGYQLILGQTCVTQSVATWDGEVPRIIIDESDFWPMYFTACRQNNPDGSVPPPPEVPTDISPGGICNMWAALGPFTGWGYWNVAGCSPMNFTPGWANSPYYSTVSIPNTTIPGSRYLYLAPRQDIWGPNTLPANIVSIPWDFSGVQATWSRNDGKIQARYQCTGWGTEPDKWANAAGSILFSSPISLVLSKVA